MPASSRAKAAGTSKTAPDKQRQFYLPELILDESTNLIAAIGFPAFDLGKTN
jgi:hypothetical protein